MKKVSIKKESDWLFVTQPGVYPGHQSHFTLGEGVGQQQPSSFFLTPASSPSNTSFVQPTPALHRPLMAGDAWALRRSSRSSPAGVYIHLDLQLTTIVLILD
ncbi:unnamed protein product [Pleuronectes platessa]|uniref:Uncharacterized protein n=1 Tax=Pleuronectes platessa TaxID=8262 RepID=A0A9N7VC46_PLEPL|nr:unnamed protein product [Pleuronectes platessa]